MKISILYLLRGIGFFKLSKFLVRKKLLILAYHGVEINDESSFSPQLFIKPITLEQRMRYLKKEGFNLLGLNEALQKFDTDFLPMNSVVITVDDGWYSTMYHADHIFSKYAYPYTIFVTSYYVKKEIPVLNIVLRYILWSCSKHTINLDLLDIPELNGSYSLFDIKKKKNWSENYLSVLDRLKLTSRK